MKRLIWKIWIPNITCLLIGFICFWLALVLLVGKYVGEAQVKEISRIVHVAEPEVNRLLVENNIEQLQQYCKKISTHIGDVRFTIIELSTGEVLADNLSDPKLMDNHSNRPEILALQNNSFSVEKRYSKTLQKMMIYYSIPIEKDGKQIAVLRYSTLLTDFRSSIVYLNLVLAFIAGFIFLGFTIVSLWLAKRVAMPINNIKKLVEDFAEGDFSKTIELPDIMELRQLVVTMNNMAIELRSRIKKVHQQRNQIEAILSGMQEGVIAINNNNEVFSINEAAEKLFDIKKKNIKGNNLFDTINFPELTSFCQSIWEIKQQDRTEKLWKNKAGEILLDIQASPMISKSGKITGLVFVFNDITRIRHLEKMRKDFVSNVSHELRTPLTSICGFVETLIDGAYKEPEDCLRFLNIINKQSLRLKRLISDLLQLSQLDRSQDPNTRNIQYAYIKPMLDEIGVILNDKLKNKAQTLNITCLPTIGCEINESLLEQAILNLMDNASNYSPNNTSITIEATNIENKLVITVQDQGPGIPEQLHERIFERFYRVDKGRSREQGGTGIGLAIVKHIVEIHNGTIRVSNNKEGGCTFTITIPCDK